MRDETMKTTFPEVILLDATHQTNDLRRPLYLMLTADSNGKSEVVSAFIVTNEEEQTIHSMIQTFKEHNPAWELVTVALTDKDMVERKTLTSEMPSNLPLSRVENLQEGDHHRKNGHHRSRENGSAENSTEVGL